MAHPREADDDFEREELARARLGTVIAGKWTLDGLLGMGATATVYSARHRNGRRVALKVLHPELANRARVRKRFLSEGYAANATNHPGAVNVLDDGEDAGVVYLVMELLSGQTLAAKIACGPPVTCSEAAGIGCAVLRVLATAHDRGILHRDVKPSNIFLTDQNDVKLLDFGAARLRDTEEGVTRSGAVLGTPAFMAPEAASGDVEAVDARSDLWSLGATLFQALTGVTVHAARSVNEALVAAATRRAPPIASVKPDVDPRLAHAIDRALAFEQADRWPNTHAMLAALEATGIAPTHSVIPHALPFPEETLPEGETAKVDRFPRGAVLVGLIGLAGVASVIAHHAITSPIREPARVTSGGEPPALRLSAPMPSAASALGVVAPSASAFRPDAPTPKASVPGASVAKRRPVVPLRPSAAATSGTIEDDGDVVLDRRK